MKAAAIILSGGKSSRMGSNKSFLKIKNKMNIEIIRDKIKPVFDDIILVTNDSQAYKFLGVKMTGDEYPGMGPLAGLHAGLEASDHEVNLVVACDMPFISAELAEIMISFSRDVDAVIPVIAGKEHPLFAVYKKDLAVAAAKCIKEGRLRMKHLLEEVSVRYVTEKDFTDFTDIEIQRIFFNMNRPQDYEDAKKWAETE
ncbi:molybdenum cofactor guanylyltransferase [Neobacillus kokaensis]|uniref:Probable molybdenum cofactor guanylyltransferase n=1 Tax=Neobacillus kokaensis TaxID=2759023 RepID=A0ABQ3MZY9_9BACI|nr:molybdenum cofactor guanylyltransferase [Neobacillus kokaensis]GHH97982.1 putative molybdenum cofactor guanylyltransferase [Neobacillus kokaensis]